MTGSKELSASVSNNHKKPLQGLDTPAEDSKKLAPKPKKGYLTKGNSTHAAEKSRTRKACNPSGTHLGLPGVLRRMLECNHSYP